MILFIEYIITLWTSLSSIIVINHCHPSLSSIIVIHHIIHHRTCVCMYFIRWMMHKSHWRIYDHHNKYYHIRYHHHLCMSTIIIVILHISFLWFCFIFMSHLFIIIEWTYSCHMGQYEGSTRYCTYSIGVRCCSGS